MSEGFEKLKDIGAQKIHERTHIAKQYVQAILHESFDTLNKIQFLGFISILEREYSISLDDLKAKGTAYFNELHPDEEEYNNVFIASKKKKSYTLFYVAIALLLFIIAASFSVTNFSSTSTEQKAQEIDNANIKSATEVISPSLEVNTDTNISQDGNNTIVEEVPTEVAIVKKSLKIIPKFQLWVGYIDLSDHSKQQKLFSNELSLDPEKDWLFSFGHGNMSIEVNSEIQEFNFKENVRFLYKDGELKKITFAEFKNLNRGSRW